MPIEINGKTYYRDYELATMLDVTVREVRRLVEKECHRIQSDGPIRTIHERGGFIYALDLQQSMNVANTMQAKDAETFHAEKVYLYLREEREKENAKLRAEAEKQTASTESRMISGISSRDLPISAPKSLCVETSVLEGNAIKTAKSNVKDLAVAHDAFKNIREMLLPLVGEAFRDNTEMFTACCRITEKVTGINLIDLLGVDEDLKKAEAIKAWNTRAGEQ